MTVDEDGPDDEQGVKLQLEEVEILAGGDEH